jgi:hypothetical protein
MKKKTLIQIFLVVCFFILVAHSTIISKWFQMNKEIDQIMSNPAYTYGTHYKRSDLNRAALNYFKYKVDNQEYQNKINLNTSGTFADLGFRNTLNRDFLVVYNKDNPALSVMVTSCPITEESQVNQYIGKAIEWRFYSGAHIKED